MTRLHDIWPLKLNLTDSVMVSYCCCCCCLGSLVCPLFSRASLYLLPSSCHLQLALAADAGQVRNRAWQGSVLSMAQYNLLAADDKLTGDGYSSLQRVAVESGNHGENLVYSLAFP